MDIQLSQTHVAVSMANKYIGLPKKGKEGYKASCPERYINGANQVQTYENMLQKADSNR